MLWRRASESSRHRFRYDSVLTESPGAYVVTENSAPFLDLVPKHYDQNDLYEWEKPVFVVQDYNMPGHMGMFL